MYILDRSHVGAQLLQPLLVASRAISELSDNITASHYLLFVYIVNITSMSYHEYTAMAVQCRLIDGKELIICRTRR